MAISHLAAALATGLALAGIAPTADGAMAADLAVQEDPGLCQTVFTALPVPPYYTRQGCIDNVITEHPLPEHRPGAVVVHQRDVLIYYHPPLIVDVYK